MLLSKKISSLVFIFSFIVVVSSQNASITIPLSKPITALNKEIYGDFLSLNRSSALQINFSSVNKNLTFIVVQVHSHLYNVTLYNNTNTKYSSVSGTNIGLYSSVKSLDTFFVLNQNVNEDLQVYLSVHGYGAKDPIPGGCNMEFPIPTSPYLLAHYYKDYILVDGAAAKAPADKSCIATKDLDVKFYRVYLPERDFTREIYFDAVKSMMTLDNILENGELIPETGTMWKVRRMVGSYPGTGAVYVAVAYATDGSYGVYVPTTTYGCDLFNDNDACVTFDDVLSQMICAAMLFTGLFVCYFGHRFFKTEMFIFSVAAGGIVTYILISLIADLDRPALLGVSILTGAMCGGLQILAWWFYGIPLVAVILPTLNLGFLLASTLYYWIPGASPVLEEDFNFWTLFIFIVIFTSVTVLSMTMLCNIPIVCSCILAAYAIVYPIDVYLGSNLKYIIINTVRRAIVPKFNHAVVSPPFQMNDAILLMLWVGLSFTGCMLQHFHNRGRPPFPPPPRALITRVPAGPIYGTLSRPPVLHPNVTPSAPAMENGLQHASERSPLLA